MRKRRRCATVGCSRRVGWWAVSGYGAGVSCSRCTGATARRRGPRWSCAAGSGRSGELRRGASRAPGGLAAGGGGGTEERGEGRGGDLRSPPAGSLGTAGTTQAAHDAGVTAGGGGSGRGGGGTGG